MCSTNSKIWTDALKDECQICTGSFHSIMYVANVKAFGHNRMWSNVCGYCFTAGGGKLGIGKGQKYKLTMDEETGNTYWLCVAGFE